MIKENGLVTYSGDELPQNFKDAGIDSITVKEGTDLSTINVDDLVHEIEEQTKTNQR
jgi:hypothetical protein